MNRSYHNVIEKIPSSFRDPSGTVFIQDGQIYRSIDVSYKENYDHLVSSGLYERLISENLLVDHSESEKQFLQNPNIYKIITPREIPFISYPYEWSFSQLKDAALLTLKIQKISLLYRMILKDATPYNVQFFNGKPVFIDTLSFEKYSEGNPWVAYRQFCMNFLSPLLIMKHNDARLIKLLGSFIGGIPLELTNILLPKKSFLRPSIFSHIYLHALSEKQSYLISINKKLKVSKVGMNALIDNLEKIINKITIKAKKSYWENYYKENSYTDSELTSKINAINEYLEIIKPKSIIDFGSNTGLFSKLASERGALTISCDFDPLCVELNYLESKKRQDKNIIPLYIDLVNPSPAIGWKNLERESFLSRIKADAIMALAIIHHLSITNNLSLEELALFFSKLTQYLIIEFIPREDVQVKSLLFNRDDKFEIYNLETFREAFQKYFNVLQEKIITQSGRTLYLMKLK